MGTAADGEDFGATGCRMVTVFASMDVHCPLSSKDATKNSQARATVAEFPVEFPVNEVTASCETSRRDTVRFSRVFRGR